HGAVWTATTSRPFRRIAQRACADSISCADHSSLSCGRLPEGVVAPCCGVLEAGNGFAGICCAHTLPAASMQNAAVVAKRRGIINDLPLLPAPGPADYAPTNRNPEVADLKQIYIAPICGKREAFAVARPRTETTCG